MKTTERHSTAVFTRVVFLLWGTDLMSGTGLKINSGISLQNIFLSSGQRAIFRSMGYFKLNYVTVGQTGD